MYDADGGVPAIEEVEFSIVHNRGCFGGCNFCAISLHQGRRVTSRSEDSVVAEAELIVKQPGFKGYIHDVGGPTANFRGPSCEKQKISGMCKAKSCLAPSPCSQLKVDHSGYLAILRRIRQIPGVKKVFIRSGVRYDYLLQDKDESFFRDLVEYHVSGQLKVAPEHCAPAVLKAMGKPSIEQYDRFSKRFYQLTKKVGKEQYLVPYLISSHPGSTLGDAAELAMWLHKNHIRPEQVQDFYPTPGTVSTCMYYTGYDPTTGKSVFVARTPEDKAMQRALLQPHMPKNKALARKALLLAQRKDVLFALFGEGAPPVASKTHTKKNIVGGVHGRKQAKKQSTLPSKDGGQKMGSVSRSGKPPKAGHLPAKNKAKTAKKERR